MRATAAFKGAAKKGVYVTCVLGFVMHACLCLSRLLQRGQHDDACLLVCDARVLVSVQVLAATMTTPSFPTSTASLLHPPSLVLRFAYNRDVSV